MGFSAEWLALREPVDHRSVDVALAARVKAHIANPGITQIVDLGSGTGSNLRGGYRLFGEAQRWILVDHDPALLKEAVRRLGEWADQAAGTGAQIALIKDGHNILVETRVADLTRELDSILDLRPDLVTAAALFDLVSERWLESFVAALVARQLPLYTVLTYDGRESWTPSYHADGAMLAAFNAHQRTDKGFGPSAGPDATAVMARLFAAAGYVAETGDSPWLLGSGDAGLIAELTRGIAEAVRQTGRVDDATIKAWLAARGQASTGLVGHLDLFARPA